MTEAGECERTETPPIEAPQASDGGSRSNAPLQDLVDAAIGGDAAAWEEIYLAIYPRLIAYARRRLDPESAKDAVAETMARSVSSLASFSWRGGGFEGWIFTILHHVITDQYRKQGRARRAALMPELHDDVDPGSGMLADEERRAMRAAFAKLPPGDQQLLQLRVVAGLSSEAVAEVLGKRSGAVRMAQARALRRLRDHFEEVSS